MTDFTVTAIGAVRGGRVENEDDDWGSVEAQIVLADSLPEEALQGLDAFSHAVIVFVFDRLDPAKVNTSTRHPRGNESWPRVGIFAQRGSPRPNRLGVTTVEVLGVQGRTLTVRGLDAIDGTPVLDIKPVMRGFEPRTPVTQPAWADEIMQDYW
ncbi:SAM-dependent methyltransferase [soil metagenome]